MRNYCGSLHIILGQVLKINSLFQFHLCTKNSMVSLIHTEQIVSLTTCCKITSLRSTLNTYPFHGANNFQSFKSVRCCQVLQVYKVISSYKISTILRQSRRVGLKRGFKLTKPFLTVRNKCGARDGFPFMCDPKFPLCSHYCSKYMNAKTIHINKIELQYCNLQT